MRLSKKVSTALFLGLLSLMSYSVSAQAETVPLVTLLEDADEAPMILSINGRAVDVSWENNRAVRELFALVQEQPVTVQTRQYGGFEQVGNLPRSLSRADVQMTTKAGDIVLYAGEQIVLFFGSNSWSYTKLGHINLSQSELVALLGSKSTQIVLSVQ